IRSARCPPPAPRHAPAKLRSLTSPLHDVKTRGPHATWVWRRRRILPPGLGPHVAKHAVRNAGQWRAGGKTSFRGIARPGWRTSCVTDPVPSGRVRKEPPMQPTATIHPNVGATARRGIRFPLGLVSGALFAIALLATASPPARAADDSDDWSFRNQRIYNYDTFVDGRLVDAQIRVDGQAAPLYSAPG